MKSISHTNKVGKSPPKAVQAKAVQAKAVPPAPVASLTIGETPAAPGITPEVAEVAPVASNPTPAIVETAAPVVRELPTASIRLDGGTQSRASLSTHTIAEYAEAMTAGATFPPVVIFFDGKTRWLADGYHRVNASLKLGRDRIACEVRQGTQRDAILFSVTANATHGLRRTTADKRHAVELLLRDSKISKKSDRAIGELCGVDNKTVAKRRAELSTEEIPQLAPTREGKDGRARNLPKAKPASANGKPASPTVAHAVAPPLSIAMAPVDEASALADLQSDIERHLLAWTWSIDPFVAALESSAQKAQRERASRAVNGKAV